MRLPTSLRDLAALVPARLVPRPPAEPPRPVPTREELASIDVNGFVSRLDANLHAIAHESALDALLPRDAAERIADPRFAHADRLFRATLRGTLVATSFRDLPVAARVHPAVQDRMWSAMDEMDVAVSGIASSLSSLTKSERAEISRALRARPELGDSILAALESEAERAGVSEERRAHLREMGKHACFRLRQSADGFIDEYTAKLRKVRPRPVAEAERYLAAQLGEPAFSREREWHLAVQREWQSILEDQNMRLASADDPGGGGISADDAYAPPAGGAQGPPPAPIRFVDPNRGKTVLKVGAALFGIGVFCGVTGSILIQGSGDAIAAGLISFTAAAVLSFVGVVCLLVGAILRLTAPKAPPELQWQSAPPAIAAPPDLAPPRPDPDRPF